jgi:hypothetical protein
MVPRASRFGTVVLLALGAIACAVAGLLLPFDPWIGLGLACALAGTTAALLCKAKGLRGLFVGLTTLVLGAWSIEVFFAFRAALAPQESYRGNYSTQEYWNSEDRDLGYSPRPGIVATSAKVVAGREIYRATYSIDQNSLRRTSPGPESASAVDCLLFFGDSFTFGEGLNDSDTLPWILQESLGPRWKVRNFAFHGYGPHQMLAAIESGRVRLATGLCPGRQLALAQFSEEQVARALGRASWDLHGPWYVPDGRGGATLAGRFDQRPGATSPALSGRYRPAILRWLDWQRLFLVKDSDRRFFVALLATARERLSREYPGAEWHLILLDTHPSAIVTSGLRDWGLGVHPIRSILPAWRPEHPDYTISGDGHPNRRYNEVLAEWLQQIIMAPPGQGAGRRLGG